jgi:hypothetical protein
MNRPTLVCALFVATAAALGAQDATQTNPQYQGQSHPPADDAIITTSIPAAKPPAGHPMNAPQYAQPSVQQAAPAADMQTLAPASEPPSAPPNSQMNAPVYRQGNGAMNAPDNGQAYGQSQPMDGTDDGIVRVAPSSAPPPAPDLNARASAYDPDGDIVHPAALRPGELQEGTSIRVHLLDRLSTAMTEKGEPFRTRVASDVLQGGQVLIPAGSEIDGRVVEVSAGHAGGHGTMRLQPESVVLPDGTRHRLHAELTSTPGSHTRVGGEGTVRPGSRVKRDSIEYGGAVGSGVVVGAVIAGPAGALTGGLIGAGAVTVHLLVDHPQATLESGTTLIFQLTDPLYLAPEAMSGN